MENEKVKEIFWQCYNVFWNKWKGETLARESPKWDEVVQEVKAITAKYNCRICNQIILALMTELEERSWGNGGDNARAYKVSRESELTIEEKVAEVNSYGISDLLYVVREFENNPESYEPEVIKQIGCRLMDEGIMLLY